MSGNLSLSGTVAQPAALLRFLCAVVLALVAMFHTCGMVSAGEIGPVAVVLDSAGDDVSSDEAGMTVEKCHFCSVVQLPATAPTVALASAQHLVPASMTPAPSPFRPAAIPPPPRGLT